MASVGWRTCGRLKRLLPSSRVRLLWGAAGVFVAASSVYWGVIASDRYVSEAHVYLQKSSALSQPPSDLLSMISGAGGDHELLLLRDHLLSVDMMKRLDGELHLRQHFSDASHDYLSRMRAGDITDERFYRYYRSMIDVTYDDYSRVLVVAAQAYSAPMAQALTQRLVVEGERYMNLLDHRAGEEQVRYIETQVADLNRRVTAAHAALLNFQNAHGLASPEQTAQSVSAIAARLDGELAALQAKRRAMQGYLTASAPDMVQINSEIAATQAQLDSERKRLATAQGASLNALVEEQGRLQAEVSFSDDLYRTALVALEGARMDSTRKINTVAILQSANEPQEPSKPRRLYNIVLSTLGALMAAGVLHLIASIIRDHGD
jgi:capsular polysaccharide transport system permease protein